MRQEFLVNADVPVPEKPKNTRLEVLTFANVPEKPENMPGEWPARVWEIGDAESATHGGIVMSLAEYEAYKRSLQSQYDSWAVTNQAEQEQAAAVAVAEEIGHAFAENSELLAALATINARLNALETAAGIATSTPAQLNAAVLAKLRS